MTPQTTSRPAAVTPDIVRIRSEVATAISELAHISPISEIKLVSAIDAGIIPHVQIIYEESDDGI